MSGGDTPAKQSLAAADPGEDVGVVGQQSRKRLHVRQRNRRDRQVVAVAAEVWQRRAHNLRVRRGFNWFDTMGR